MRSCPSALGVLAVCLLCFSCAKQQDSASIKTHFDEAYKEYQKGEFRKAIVHGEAIISSVPFYGEMYSFIGYCYLDLNEVDKGVKYLKRGIDYQPYDLKALRVLCELPYEGKSIAENIEFCTRCVEMDRTFVKGYENCILSFLKAGETRKAEDMLVKLNEVDAQAAGRLKEHMSSVN